MIPRPSALARVAHLTEEESSGGTWTSPFAKKLAQSAGCGGVALCACKAILKADGAVAAPFCQRPLGAFGWRLRNCRSCTC